MKTNKSWLIVFAAIVALASAQTSRAITFGEPDNGGHPNVGAVMFVFPNLPNLPNPAQFLSGTLIAPNLFLTAGHGTDYLEWLRGAGVLTFDNVFVTFSDDPTDKTAYLRIKEIRTHPGYKRPARVSVEKDIFEYVHGAGSIPVDDMGILVLEQPIDPTQIEPARLPSMGFLDILRDARQLNPETQLLAVGYGCRATFRPSTVVGLWEPHNREWALSEYRALNDRCLTLSMNQVLGNGGTGLGDSGGPRYWIDPVDGSEHLVAITETGSPNLVSLDVAYRIDTPAAQDFIESVKKDYPLPQSLLAGEAKAAKGPPPAFVMWPKGAKLVLTYFPWTQIGLGPLVLAQWPSANGADHYRVTVVFKSGGVTQVSNFTLDASRTDCVVGGPKGTYLVTVTAYSGADEAAAYSESLEGRISSR